MKAPTGLSFTALVLIALGLIAWLNPKILTLPHFKVGHPPAASASANPGGGKATTQPTSEPTSEPTASSDADETPQP